ncbi:efflux RND transporter periplasmic adaptor subunit [Halomicronema sp. CCY15110]|uniref:efflux RND transporter periplasmic adaptor subunit n=1 Tax=Halomicronema sp. CCY15110 TaxID=2767773 RepID=UPI001EF3B36A|nr:efflux RND transporter periplasmic adaptor subunit [Halomicronema sp. CCY15110]
MLTSAASDRRLGVGRWLIAGGIGILLLAGGFLVWRFMGARGQGGMGMPPGVTVQLEPVQTGNVQDASEFLGSLEAQTGVVLQPEVSGRVTQVYVSAGDRVNPGQPIVLISPDRTQAEANAATANAAAAESARQAAAASLQALLARRAELEAELALQEAEFNRTEQLVSQGAQSQQALDLARRDLEVAQATLASARDEIAAAQANLNQAEASLAQAQANQAAAQQSLQDRTVTAPIAGTVGNLNIKLGDFVSTNTVITNITENAALELDLQIPIEQRNRLELGLPVELLSVEGENKLATGGISFISPSTDPDTQTVLVKARFENPQGRLQDAQKVEARIVWSETTGVLVPTAAITRLGGQTFVYVADAGTEEELPPPNAMPPGMPAPEQVARLRPVQLGELQGNNYEVLSGLEAGQTIVVSGILNLQDGTPILPQSETEGPPADESSGPAS